MQTKYVTVQLLEDMWRLCSGWKSRGGFEQWSTTLVQYNKASFLVVHGLEKEEGWRI
jgi:hypothetical protein